MCAFQATITKGANLICVNFLVRLILLELRERELIAKHRHDVISIKISLEEFSSERMASAPLVE